MTTPTDPSSLPSEAPASAPATPLTNPNLVTTMRQPMPVNEPLRLSAGLCLANNADAALRLPGDMDLMEQLSRTLKVELRLDAPLVQRLFHLWNGAIQLSVDEVGDWALDAMANLVCASDIEAPELAGLGATVYANGDVAFFIQLLGVEAPLWFAEPLDLSRLAAN